MHQRVTRNAHPFRFNVVGNSSGNHLGAVNSTYKTNNKGAPAKPLETTPFDTRARLDRGAVSASQSDSKGTGEFIMPRGKVKWFNNAKGYGFIIEDGCSDDLFAHFSSVQMEGYKTLKAGQTVTFDKKPSDKGVHAINIVPDEVPARESGQKTASVTSDQSVEQEHSNESYSPRAVNS